jgi:diguanylate cyclase (GGDEF)-like protein
MPKKKDAKELTSFQLRNIEILTHLYKFDAIDDDIVETLRKSELEYFALLDKYKLLEKKVNIDEKTNLLRFKQDYLTYILKTASRVFYGIKSIKYPVSFVRFDIDDFSQFNNLYGHDIGDDVLIKIATIIRENSRPTDYPIRFGGEEFDVILPTTDIEGAQVYVAKILQLIREDGVIYKKKKLNVTVSAGISCLLYDFYNNRSIKDLEIEEYFRGLQNEADNALYEAKYLGKDRYCLYSKQKKDEYAKIRKLYVK